MIRFQEKAGAGAYPQHGYATTGASFLDIGEGIELLQRLRLDEGLSAGQRRAASTALARLGRMRLSPERAGGAVIRAAERLASSLSANDLARLTRMGAILTASPALFTANAPIAA